MRQSARLTEFYRDYLFWAEHQTGHPHPIFDVKMGLCSALIIWATHKQYDTVELSEELNHQFDKAGLSTSYPFNQDADDFALEWNRTINGTRMAWVMTRAKYASRA